MAHGANIKQGHTSTRRAIVGDVVGFYQMTSAVSPGPHTAIGEYATRVDLRVGNEIKENVDHRSAAEGPRLWDWK